LRSRELPVYERWDAELNQELKNRWDTEHFAKRRLCTAWGEDRLGYWICDNQSKNNTLPGPCSSHQGTLSTAAPYDFQICKCQQRRMSCRCRQTCVTSGCGNFKLDDRQTCILHSRPRKYSPHLLTEKQKEAMRGKGKCDLCLKPHKALHIDHDHSHCPPGKYCRACIRGSLCPGCNTRLVAGYEALPESMRDSLVLNKYLQRRPMAVAGET
jgi:hypothetical protein